MRHGARVTPLSLIPLAVAAQLLAGAGSASAATLTVCPSGCQYSQIAPAVAAARNGDTIQIGPGTYRGGITVDVSVRLAGAGPRSTIIRGGGHVLTIGAFGAVAEPTVSITGVTITGGVARTTPQAAQLGGRGVWAGGGGVEIPPGALSTTGIKAGATVTITSSVITGNRADPSASVPAGRGIPCPPRFPHGQCRFALAAGGGIESWGRLTLADSAVTGNSIGPGGGLPAMASDADGGGIYSAQGDLRMTRTLVAGNRARAAAPNGRFAEGGGIFVAPAGGSLRISDSAIVGNSASLTTNLPKFAHGTLIAMNANSGGLHVGDGIAVAVANTLISCNSVAATDSHGEPAAIDAAMMVAGGPLTMTSSAITGNRVTATVATTVGTGSDGNVLEADGGGTISHTSISGNSVTVASRAGQAGNAGAGLVVITADEPRLLTVTGSTISRNTAIAWTSTGTASVQAVGILNNSLLRLDRTRVSGNSGRVTGSRGSAQGGGIWNGVEFSGPPVKLVLDDSQVTRNSLTGSPAITLRGGGLYTTVPVTLSHSLIAYNRPDQCFGCNHGRDQLEPSTSMVIKTYRWSYNAAQVYVGA